MADIEAIEKRWQASSKGPWHTGDADQCVYGPVGLIAKIEYQYDNDGSRGTNAEFIAHSWQDIKDLLEENKRLREKLKGK